MMRYFIDTEYDWDPSKGKIALISIALVADDGREFYAVNIEYDRSAASDWIKQNVLPQLAGQLLDPSLIRQRIIEFIGADIPEFWGDYAAFDYVILSMVMGNFDQWPRDWPMHINDLQQESIPSLPSEINHHALCDARAVRESLLQPNRGAADE